MSDRAVELGSIDWKAIFPWLRLFRAFRTAIDLRMLVLGVAALVVLALGDMVFVHLPFAPDRPEPATPINWSDPVGTPPARLPARLLDDPAQEIRSLASNWRVVLRPAETIFVPSRTILRASASWSDKTFAWTRLLWALCVWAVFGGAMTRIVAVEHARETRLSLFEALRFSFENFFSYLTATLLPFAGIAVFWILCLIGGWIARIPVLGGFVIGLLWGLELAVGFVMTLILIGAAVGWPLMYATVSTEASDGFDGFSRAYSYIYGRPWHYAWYGIVALVYGAIVTTFVSIVVWLVAYLSAAGVASGLGVSGTSQLLMGAADSIGGAGLVSGTSSANIGIGTVLVGAWLGLLGLVLYAFVTSYFWTAVTIIYFLLRHVDDATDFHEVFLPEAEKVDDLLPLVGVAASDQPLIERPPGGDFAAGSNAPPESHPPGLRGDKSPNGAENGTNSVIPPTP